MLGNQVAVANLIEIIDPKVQLTMHLRSPNPQGPFTARALVFYTENLEDVPDGDQIVGPPARQIVDQQEATFTIDL